MASLLQGGGQLRLLPGKSGKVLHFRGGRGFVRFQLRPEPGDLVFRPDPSLNGVFPAGLCHRAVRLGTVRLLHSLRLDSLPVHLKCRPGGLLGLLRHPLSAGGTYRFLKDPLGCLRPSGPALLDPLLQMLHQILFVPGQLCAAQQFTLCRPDLRLQHRPPVLHRDDLALPVQMILIPKRGQLVLKPGHIIPLGGQQGVVLQLDQFPPQAVPPCGHLPPLLLQSGEVNPLQL